jgi:hypothetical protein
MRKVILILDIVAFIASLIWAMIEPGYEPFIAVITSLGVLFAILFTKSKDTPPVKNKAKGKSTIFSQNAGDSATQYQAKGDINIKK